MRCHHRRPPPSEFIDGSVWWSIADNCCCVSSAACCSAACTCAERCSIPDRQRADRAATVLTNGGRALAGIMIHRIPETPQ